MISKLNQWIHEVRLTGGVADGHEVVDAISAVTALCWDDYYRQTDKHSNMAQLGIKWISAFAVSCAKNGEGQVNSIRLGHGDADQARFSSEATKNSGILHELLMEAAKTPRQLFESAMVAAGIHHTAGRKR